MWKGPQIPSVTIASPRLPLHRHRTGPRKIKPVTSEQTKTFDLSASFKAYDVRGIVGDSITAEIVEAVGAAFVDVLQLEGQTVLVGGDMRPSSPEFSKAFADGAATRGANVQLLDLISTDELYFACGSLNAAGATFTVVPAGRRSSLRRGQPTMFCPKSNTQVPGIGLVTETGLNSSCTVMTVTSQP